MSYWHEAATRLAVSLRTERPPSENRIRREYGVSFNLSRTVLDSAQEQHMRWMMGHFAKPIRMESNDDQ